MKKFKDADTVGREIREVFQMWASSKLKGFGNPRLVAVLLTFFGVSVLLLVLGCASSLIVHIWYPHISVMRSVASLEMLLIAISIARYFMTRFPRNTDELLEWLDDVLVQYAPHVKDREAFIILQDQARSGSPLTTEEFCAWTLKEWPDARLLDYRVVDQRPMRRIWKFAEQ